MAAKREGGIRQTLRNWKYSYNRAVIDLRPYTRFILNFLGVLAFIAAIFCIISGAVYVGFNHNETDAGHLSEVIKVCQIVFIINVVFNIVLKPRENTRNSRLLKWIVDIAILLTLPSLLFPNPQGALLAAVESVAYNKWVIYAIVGSYAIVEFSYGLNKVLDRKINPSMLLASSFLFFIIIGSFILMMPRCTVNGISYIDSLFV